MKDIDFLNHEPHFTSKTVDVSIEKSNIKSKENTYYARVCNKGHVDEKTLLSILKRQAPYIDITMIKMAFEKMQEVIINLVKEGKTVDFFGLGSFSLSTKGKVEIKEGMRQYVDGNMNVSTEDIENESEEGKSLYDKVQNVEKKNGDFDVSKAIIKPPKFYLKFAASLLSKKEFKDVKIACAIKKRRSPVIKKIEDGGAKACDGSVRMIKIKGSNLKVLGERAEVGVYIKGENGKEVKIERGNIIQNMPTTLVILLDRGLKAGAKYRLSLITQYAKMGSACKSQVLRGTSFQFLCKQKLLKSCA